MSTIVSNTPHIAKPVVINPNADVINILSNGTGSIPTIVNNTKEGIYRFITNQITSSVSASVSDINKVGSGFDVVMGIIANGTASNSTTITNASFGVKKSN